MSRTSNDANDRTRREIRGWRDSLINLTGSNRLLKYADKKTTSVEIVRPDPESILTGLAANRLFRFHSISHQEDPLTGGSLAEPRGVQGVVDTRKDGKDLGAALRTLARRAGQEFLDREVWVLYLALGMLIWADEDATRLTSPLLLVPVR